MSPIDLNAASLAFEPNFDLDFSVDDRDADERAPFKSATILAADRTLPTDTWESGVNNNLLVLGPSGAGKTRHVLVPNLLQMDASVIVLDVKGTLCRKLGGTLAAHGYEVQNLNFSDLAVTGAHTVGYNPLAYVRRDAQGRPNQQDIISIAHALCPVEDSQDPFWEHAAANYLACFIAYTLEMLPEEEHTLESVLRLSEAMNDGTASILLERLEEVAPESFACRLYRRAAATQTADKMHASILGIIAEKVMCLGFDAAVAMYRRERQVDFARMSHERVALFVTVSDIDRSLAPLTDLFITQAFRTLCREADAAPEGRLERPVRFYLDDFSNLRVPGFEDLIATIRSREIWCTILCQTATQIEQRYGAEGAAAIIGNCDAQLVLSFQDAQTARAFADRANKPASALLATPPESSWLFVRGRPAELVRRYDVTEHPRYAELGR